MTERPDLAALRADDLPVHTGRTLAYVYDSGLAELDEKAAAAVGSFAAVNGLDPTVFPSLLTMENDVVRFVGALVDAPEGFAGNVTSGGTESILLAVLAAREAHPTSDPLMVVPDTVHAAFHKAAKYFGVEAVTVPTGEGFRADVDATRRTVEAAGERCALVVVSAPSYAHGVVDPITEVAAIAAEAGARCHVDACVGGMVLPFAARAGRPVEPWTFAVPGVTSISIDLHKYGYAPKGASVLLHREAHLRRGQYFAWADWPGYTMLNSTVQSTKSGGPLAGAWTVLTELGDEGFLGLTRRSLEATDRITAAIRDTPELELVVEPAATLIAFETGPELDPFTLTDELNERGWYVQPQLSYAGRSPNVHLSVSAATADHIDEFVGALRESVAAAIEAGPIAVDPGVAEVIDSLDPATLTDADFDGLLAVAGLGAGADGGGLALPDRRAEINALLDRASPALREAVLVAFLDRLQRPS